MIESVHFSFLVLHILVLMKNVVVGEPKLMMVATRDGQWDPQLFQHRYAILSNSNIRKSTKIKSKKQ
jgi:hypothetical protein